MINKKVDWYLYQNYIEIRVYGWEFSSYKLPKFVPIRIFALEYIWKMININDMHFVISKRKSQFKRKAHVGPFVCNTRTTRKEVDILLK